jgi:hypothetical protein
MFQSNLKNERSHLSPPPVVVALTHLKEAMTATSSLALAFNFLIHD